MDPFKLLRWEKQLMKLKERILAEGSKVVFLPIIEKYILKNHHRVTVEMQPGPETGIIWLLIKKSLEKLKASMTEEKLAEFVRAMQELRLKYKTLDPPEALRSVPCLFLHDILKNSVHIPTEIGNIMV